MADQAALVKKAMLQAGAQGGKLGADEYGRAISNVTDMRQQALSDAAARSGALNAPQNFINKQAGIAAMPGNASLPLLQALQSSNANATGAIQKAQGNYAASLGQSRNLLAQQANAANANPMVNLSAADKAASLYEKLLKQANGGISPSEKRAEQQFQWAQEAQQEKQNNKFVGQRQNELEQTWAKSADPLDQTVFGLASQYDNFGQAVNALQSDASFKKLYKKLNPQQQSSIQEKLQSYYDPIGYREANSVSTIDILNQTRR